jgi:hypothetical protein
MNVSAESIKVFHILQRPRLAHVKSGMVVHCHFFNSFILPDLRDAVLMHNGKGTVTLHGL